MTVDLVSPVSNVYKLAQMLGRPRGIDAIPNMPKGLDEALPSYLLDRMPSRLPEPVGFALSSKQPASICNQREHDPIVPEFRGPAERSEGPSTAATPAELASIHIGQATDGTAGTGTAGRTGSAITSGAAHVAERRSREAQALLLEQAQELVKERDRRLKDELKEWRAAA